MNDFVIDGEEIQLEADGPVKDKSRGKGFSDPDVLAKAQATRAANREHLKVVSPDDGEVIPLKTKRAGRPKGSTNKRERNLQGMVNILVSMHMMIATATKQPILAISQEEGQMLADALANLADHYKIDLDGKPGAVIGLIYAAGAVYGTRAIALTVAHKFSRNEPDDNSAS